MPRPTSCFVSRWKFTLGDSSPKIFPEILEDFDLRKNRQIFYGLYGLYGFIPWVLLDSATTTTMMVIRSRLGVSPVLFIAEA